MKKITVMAVITVLRFWSLRSVKLYIETRLIKLQITAHKPIGPH